MLKHGITLTLLLLLLAAIGVMVQAQEAGADVPLFAAVENGTVTTYPVDRETRDVISAFNIQDMVWNAEGILLAMIIRDENFQSSMVVYDRTDDQVRFINQMPLAAGFGIGWTRDGRILAAVENHMVTVEAPGVQVDATAIDPMTSATEILGSFYFGVGCGGGSPIPADWAYNAETDGFGGFFLTLADTPAGIVYSLNCGGVGIGIIDPTADETRVLDDTLSRVVIVPDGNRAAGIRTNMIDRSMGTLVLLDLNTGSAVDIATSGEPDQLAWSADGQAIYYSTRTMGENIITQLSDEQRDVITQDFGFEMTELYAFSAGVHRVELVTGSDNEIFNANAYAVGRMSEVNGALYVSLVPNMNEWLIAVGNGETSFMADNWRQYVPVSVMRLALDAAPEATLLGFFEQFSPATGN